MLLQAKDIDFHYITNADEVIELVEILKSQQVIALDTEGFALYEEYGNRASWKDPHTSRWRLMQINIIDNRIPWVVDRLKISEEGLNPLIDQLKREDLIKVIHNAKYDLKIIKSTSGIWMPNTHCTMVMMQRMGLCTGFKSSQLRGHSLKSLARDFFNIKLSKVEQTSDWSTPDLTIEQLEYAALDVGAPRSSSYYSILLEAYLMLMETLTSPLPNGYGVAESLEYDLESNQILAQIEYSGMPINDEMLSTLMTSAKQRLQECKIKMCKDLDLPIEQRIKITARGPEHEVIIPDRVSKLLNNPKALTVKINERLQLLLGFELTDAQSDTLEKVLSKLQEDSKEAGASEELEDEEEGDIVENFFIEECQLNIEIISNILEYKTLLKLTGTDYLSIINPVTGCLHSNVNCIGASTGRMSSGGGSDTFNSQQLSKVDFKIPALENPFKSNSKVF